MLSQRAGGNVGSSALSKRKRQSRFLFDPDEVMKKLRANIIGQEEMKSAVDDMLYRVKADFSDREKPLAVMFFLGPTGVGKSQTVKVLAEAIHGHAEHFCKIDMNTLSQQHYAAAITGAPPGYVGSKEGHTLFNRELVQGSFSKPGIVLFDEIEKANRDVVRTLLNILDVGKLNLAAGTGEVDFRNSLIFMTSNIGAREVRKKGQLFSRLFRPSQEKSIFLDALQKHFDPEFLNRIHNTLVFQEIETNRLDDIIDLQIQTLCQRLAPHGVTVDLSMDVRKQLKSSYNRYYGARDLVRQFRQLVETPLARALLAQQDVDHFVICLRQNAAVAEPFGDRW